MLVVAAQTGLTALFLLAAAAVAGLVVGRSLSRLLARAREARRKETAPSRRTAARSQRRGGAKRGAGAKSAGTRDSGAKRGTRAR